MGDASQSNRDPARAASALSDLTRSGAVRRGAAGLGARPDRVVATGVAALDRALPGGGLPCGYLSELAGPPSCGKLGLAARALAGALAAGERAALVDASRSFFPLSPELVRALARLLVCRVATVRDALSAAELLAASGGVGLVAVDLARAGALDAGDRAALARLVRAAREGSAAVLAVTEPAAGTESLLGPIAALRIEAAASGAREVAPRLRVARSRLHQNRAR